MHRLRFLLLLVSLLLLACQAATRLVSPLAPQLPIPSGTLQPTPWNTATPTQQARPQVSPSDADDMDPAQTDAATPGGVTSDSQAALGSTSISPGAGAFQVRLHPDGPLYVGDQVSFEILSAQEIDTQGLTLTLTLSEPVNAPLGQATFGGYGIAGRDQATLYWAWDTSTYEAGLYTLSYAIQPLGLAFTETVTLQPASQLPPPEPLARWAWTTTECCTLHYVTGTAAERDLDRLATLVDEQADQVSQKLGAEFDEQVSIVLLPRVLGHGGFSSQEISVSYLDRNYAGSSTQIVLHHEMVHALDSQLGGELRPTLLVEGLAVYLSGGHFKPEPLMPRAAALLEMDWYLPLEELADNFYPSQHETGYLEAGALVEFMVETWGWPAFSDFYRSIRPAPDGGSQSQAINAALQDYFELSFVDLESRFIDALRAEMVSDAHRRDVRLTVQYYDLVRSYQQAFDPSAHFMTAWLPDGQQMRQRGIVADYLRHPVTAENLALEALLLAADSDLRSGNYPQAEGYLAAVEMVLESGFKVAGRANQLAADTIAITKLLVDRGYQVQRVAIQDDKARVWASPGAEATAGLAMNEFELTRSQDGWSILEQLNY